MDIDKYPNNQPVADFHCSNCCEEYELKSKHTAVGTKIVDGAYRTMLERLASSNNPNFFLLKYDLKNFEVTDFPCDSKAFFVPDIIEERKPLANGSSGWLGRMLNILLQSIPQTGKIFLFAISRLNQKRRCFQNGRRRYFCAKRKRHLRKDGYSIRCGVLKDWERMNSLDDVYTFENELQGLHPDNRHIRDKIRQQLQVLRDKGYLDLRHEGDIN